MMITRLAPRENFASNCLCSLSHKPGIHIYSRIPLPQIKIIIINPTHTRCAFHASMSDEMDMDDGDRVSWCNRSSEKNNKEDRGTKNGRMWWQKKRENKESRKRKQYRQGIALILYIQENGTKSRLLVVGGLFVQNTPTTESKPLTKGYKNLKSK